jgi:hypothetical protein
MSPLSSYFTHDENETIRRYAFLVEAVVWGPAWWRLLNYIAFGARLNVDSFRCIVLSLSMLMPCPVCREHMGAYLSATPTPEHAELCAEWLVRFHNSVNERRALPLMTTADVRKETLGYLDEEHGSVACSDLWTALLTLACKYEPMQCSIISTLIVHVSRTFPLQSATAPLVEMTDSCYASASTLYTAIWSARNAWACGVGESPWSFLDTVERTCDMSETHVALGIADAGDLALLRERCAARLSLLCGARMQANIRASKVVLAGRLLANVHAVSPSCGHTLRRMDSQVGWRCDGCFLFPDRDIQRFRCSEGCDFDLCAHCYDSGMTDKVDGL